MEKYSQPPSSFPSLDTEMSELGEISESKNFRLRVLESQTFKNVKHRTGVVILKSDLSKTFG